MMTHGNRSKSFESGMITTTTTVGQPAPQQPQYQPPPASEDIWAVQRPKRTDPKEAEIARELRSRIVEWQSADQEWQNNARFELDFLDDHWIEEETGRRTGLDMESIGRSAFNIDLLNPAIDLVVNTARINKVTASFVPQSEGADEATAEVRQGLYRNIDRESNAAVARETGYQLAVSVGRGYWRVIIEDDDGATFAKHIGIQRVDNILSIAMDPTCLDFMYADAEWGYAFDDMSSERFRTQYEKSSFNDDGSPNQDFEAVDVTGLGLTDAERLWWFPKDHVRVGEYFRKRWKMRTVVKLEDGSEKWKDLAKKGEIVALPDGTELWSGVRITNQKDKLDFEIEWRKMTGTQTIEKRIWPGRFIPIVVCVGREVFRGRRGKIHRGLIRPAIAPVRLHDVMFSRMADEVALSPLPHFISYTGQLSEENKKLINTINRQPWSNVELLPMRDADGRPLPMVGWVSPSPNTAAVVQAAELASQKMDRVLNTYAPNRGQAIADQSGRAIREIKDSGDIAHAAFPDNLSRAILHEARIVNNLMDVVYTDAQAITITEPDEKTRRLLINQEYKDPKTGKMVKHIFGSSAKYGVALATEPYSPSRAREAATMLLGLGKEFPQIQQVLDLLIRDMGVPNYQKYTTRLRPPGFHDDGEGPDATELQQQVQQLQQLDQQSRDIIQKLISKVNELGDKNFMERLRLATQERIAAAGDRTTLAAAAMTHGQEANMAVLNAQLQAILRALENDSPENQPQAPKTQQATAQASAAPVNGSPAPPVQDGPAPGGEPPQ